MTNNIVVIGGGVTGLTTALFLSKSKANKVTLVGKHMPGDMDIEYASPFAGANIMPMLPASMSVWERRTWPELKRLTQGVPEAGIHFQKCRVYRRDQDLDKGSAMDPLFDVDPWYKSMMDGFRELGPDELIPGVQSGCEFSSACINVVVYCNWLVGQLLKNGVVLKRANLAHIREAKDLSHTGEPANFIINCTGLGSLKLGGVEDKNLTPSRGQTVLVRNEAPTMISTSGTDDGASELFYIMQRAAGGGTILGGTYDLGNWDPVPNPEIGQRIMKRIVEAVPELAGGKGIEGLDVIRHQVGLRPYRHGGVRVEEDKLEDGTAVVHNYGHAGWGYQGSYGCAEKVVELVNKVRKEKGQDLSEEPKLFLWDTV